ncbi:hypothetical protein PGIGA_G00130510, partial [Pangasianodon gigas]|nr:hypothetical protein [Pangasianodon gigas]
ACFRADTLCVFSHTQLKEVMEVTEVTEVKESLYDGVDNFLDCHICRQLASPRDAAEGKVIRAGSGVLSEPEEDDGLPPAYL